MVGNDTNHGHRFFLPVPVIRRQQCLDEMAQFIGHILGRVHGLGYFGPNGLAKVIAHAVDGHFDCTSGEVEICRNLLPRNGSFISHEPRFEELQEVHSQLSLEK